MLIVINYLLSFAHRHDRLQVVGLMTVVGHALTTDRQLAAHAVHGKWLVMLAADRLSKLRGATRLGKCVLSQWATCRMTKFTTSIAVTNFTLLANDRCHFRWFSFTHLTSQGFTFAEAIHNRFHRPIQWQISGAKFVKEYDLTANGASEREYRS